MDRTDPFVRTLFLVCEGHGPSVRAIVEQMRMFGYIQEPEYSQMNTIVSRSEPTEIQRTDQAETIEMARGGTGTGKPVPVDQIPTEWGKPVQEREKQIITAEDVGVLDLDQILPGKP